MSEQVKTAITCRHCQHQMERVCRKKYSKRWATVLVVSGVLCCLFIVGALVGIPLLLAGIYMATAEETINHCPSCGHYFKVWISDKASV